MFPVMTPGHMPGFRLDPPGMRNDTGIGLESVARKPAFPHGSGRFHRLTVHGSTRFMKSTVLPRQSGKIAIGCAVTRSGKGRDLNLVMPAASD